MKTFYLKIFLVVFIVTGCNTAKKTTRTADETLNNLKAHIEYLADDKLEGRRTGTKGEEMAVEYIHQQFYAIGLQPKGTENYTQTFIINEGRQIDPETALSINGNPLVATKDFFPFPYSPEMKMDALPSIAVQEAGMPWFFDLKETLAENSSNPHFDLQDYIRNNSKKAADRGASAVIIYNTSATDDKLVFNGKDRSEKLSIPVLYVTKPAAEKYFSDPTATLNL